MIEVDVTVTPLTVMAVSALMVAPVRFVPAMVTPTAVPCVPLLGVIEVSAGAGFTVNVTALLVTPPAVTVTLCAPVGAVLEMVNVAVIELAVTVTALTVMPVGALIVAPVRFEPAMVTGTTAPWLPLSGVIEVNEGAGLTVKVTGLLVPPAAVTVTLCAPVGAVPAMVKVAVIELAVTVTPLTVMPVGALMVAPVRFDPASVTPTVPP